LGDILLYFQFYNKSNLKNIYCWAPAVHACNPRYSGGRDQEYRSSEPAWANSLRDLISKKPNIKKGLVEWLKVKALSSNHSTTKKNIFCLAQYLQNIIILRCTNNKIKIALRLWSQMCYTLKTQFQWATI
jgi:hypothetical protein